MVRGGQEPPPEQINRLHVLTDSGKDLPLIVSDVCQGKCSSVARVSDRHDLPLHGLSGQVSHPFIPASLPRGYGLPMPSKMCRLCLSVLTRTWQTVRAEGEAM